MRGLDADNYIVKPFAREVLLTQIHALLCRREPEQPVVLRFAGLRLSMRTR